MMKDEVASVWSRSERDGLELEVSGVFVCEGPDGEEQKRFRDRSGPAVLIQKSRVVLGPQKPPSSLHNLL